MLVPPKNNPSNTHPPVTMFKLTSQLILLTRVWIKYTRPLKPKPRDSGGKQWHPTSYLSNICSCRVGRETLSSNEAEPPI